jgi:hypothetical protein
MASSITNLSPDALIESFPPPTLPNIQGEPTYPQLAAILKEIKANAASVLSVQGGGSNGHLSIVVSDTVYSTIAPGTPFIKPANPAQHPTIPHTSTDGAITLIMPRHNERQRKFQECNNVQQALKNQLARAIDGIYLEAHKDNNVGYGNISIEVLLQYLFDKNGDITPVDLRADAKRLNEEWGPSQPIQALYSCIKDIQTHAQAGNRTFTDQQIVDTASTIIYKTGVYYDDCEDWLETTPQHQTWINFQKHFNAAHCKAKRKQRTTQLEGYHSVNGALQTDDNLQAKNETTTEALANMATAMSANHNTMGQLTNAIADLTARLSSPDQEITTLKSKLRGNNSGTRNNTNSNGESSQSTAWVNGKARLRRVLLDPLLSSSQRCPRKCQLQRLKTRPQERSHP